MPTNLAWILLGTGAPWPGELATYLCNSLCLSPIHWMHTSHTGLYTTHMERPLVRQRETIKGYFLPWPHNISFSLGVHVFFNWSYLNSSFQNVIPFQVYHKCVSPSKTITTVLLSSVWTLQLLNSVVIDDTALLPLLSHYLCKTCCHSMTTVGHIAINTSHAIMRLPNGPANREKKWKKLSRVWVSGPQMSR